MSRFRALWLWLGILLVSTTLLTAQTQYKYSYMPKRVYTNQLFPVTIIGTKSAKEKVSFGFDTNSWIQPLTKEPLIIQNGSDRFYTFYFKANSQDIEIPELSITSPSHVAVLPAQFIPVTPLKPRADYCGVLAADMKIKSHQVSNYDETHHLVTLSLEAFEANIEDINLSSAIESGVEQIKRLNAKVEAEFYLVLPSQQTELKFTYFNTIKKQYQFLEVAIALRDDSVSTQSDLNPREDSFEKLKKYALTFFVLFFLIMFIVRRDFFYLVWSVVVFITLLTRFIPHEKICVKKGASLHILPTQTSTITMRTDQEFKAILLGERESFKKIEYQKGVIGWIDDEDICQD